MENVCPKRGSHPAAAGKHSQGKYIEIIELVLHEKWDGTIAFSLNILKYQTITLYDVANNLIDYSNKLYDFSKLTTWTLGRLAKWLDYRILYRTILQKMIF